MSSYLLLLLLGFGIPIGGMLYNLKLILEILRDIRGLRILHYVSLMGLGIALYISNPKNQIADYEALFFEVSLFVMALIYAAIFAIITNNIEDLETDKISNTDRPLVIQSVNQKEYLLAGIICQVWAMILASFINSSTFWAILLISIGYYVYSCRPFRLKKIPIVAKIIIGFNSLTVAVGGFALAGGTISDFPPIWIFYTLIPLALSANFVDLKDIEGDRAMNVRTLPVIWGETNAKHFIASMTVLSYLIPSIILNIWWLFPIVFLLLVTHIWLLYRKPYAEKPIFMIYVSSIFGLIFFIMIKQYL